ncbi:MAG: SIS domain-containing protein [Pirellulaceae bacterium]
MAAQALKTTSLPRTTSLETTSHQTILPIDLQAPEARIARGRQILRSESSALELLSNQLGNQFADAVELLSQCKGRIVVTGIGKAGIIGQKFAASLSSTGSPAFFLHPSEAVHGDLGSVRSEDCVVFFSYSGETEEVTRLLPILLGAEDRPTTVAVTRSCDSTLSTGCDVAIPLGKHDEACSLGLAPTTSTTLMLALSDALVLVTSELKGFSRVEFGQFHPGGNLGRQLMTVTDAMRPLEECRVASDGVSVREVLVQIARPGRRTGAIMLVSDAGKLTGIFTDSDLARLLEQQQDGFLDRPVAELMTAQFRTVDATAELQEAVNLIKAYKLSEIPVVDTSNCPVGIVDITDVVDIQTTTEEAPSQAAASSQNSAQIEATGVSTGTRSGHGSGFDGSSESGVPRILNLIKFQQENAASE